MSIAKDNGQFISFDPNYREDLWRGRVSEFVSVAKKAIAVSDFVKVSDEASSLTFTKSLTAIAFFATLTNSETLPLHKSSR